MDLDLYISHGLGLGSCQMWYKSAKNQHGPIWPHHCDDWVDGCPVMLSSVLFLRRLEDTSCGLVLVLVLRPLVLVLVLVLRPVVLVLHNGLIYITVDVQLSDSVLNQTLSSNSTCCRFVVDCCGFVLQQIETSAVWAFVSDQACQPPGCDLPRQLWSMLNCFQLCC